MSQIVDVYEMRDINPYLKLVRGVPFADSEMNLIIALCCADDIRREMKLCDVMLENDVAPGYWKHRRDTMVLALDRLGMNLEEDTVADTYHWTQGFSQKLDEMQSHLDTLHREFIEMKHSRKKHEDKI